jgi:DNA-binding phage protein
MDLTDIFEEDLNIRRKERTKPIATIAAEVGVARGTVYKAIADPESAKLKLLRSICRAMGYEMRILLKKKDIEEEK